MDATINSHVVFSVGVKPGRSFSPFWHFFIVLEDRGNCALAIELKLIDQSDNLEVACENLRLKTLAGE